MKLCSPRLQNAAQKWWEACRQTSHNQSLYSPTHVLLARSGGVPLTDRKRSKELRSVLTSRMSQQSFTFYL